MLPFVAGILFTIAAIGAILCFCYLIFLAFASNDAKEQNKKEKK